MTKGKDLLELAAKHIGEDYVFGVSVPKNNENWRGPWDCAEFVSWCVYQKSGILYGCNNDNGNPALADAYTGYWADDSAKLGKIISIADAAKTPGAAVLRIAAGGKTGHIVFSDGTGGTIEAHSSNSGVIRSTLNNRRWDRGILVPGIEYDSTSQSVVVSAPSIIYRFTKPLMKGDKVKEIQNKLSSLGFDPGVIDGEFGPHTMASVMAYQQTKGMVVDGEVGKDTAKALGIILS